MRNGIRLVGLTVVIIVTILLITRCGGGGGDSAPSVQPLVYTGVTEPVAITLSNAPVLLANVLFDTTTTTEMPGAVTITQNSPIPAALSDFNEYLLDLGRHTLETIIGNPTDGLRLPAAEVVNETEECETGYFTAQGTLDGVTGTGTLTVNYYNCLLDGVTADGSLLLHIHDIQFDEITGDYRLYFTYEYLLMTFTSADSNVSASGMITVDESFSGNTFSLQLTKNFVKQDNLQSNKMYRYENYVETATAVADALTVRGTTAITGAPTAVVYDSLYGSLVVDTPEPFTYSSAYITYADGGGPMVFNGDKSGMQLTPVSARHAKLELDKDGAPGYEVVRYTLWTELENYTSLDLVDSDGDGMHDSWEGAHGLDVNVDDATADIDGDGLTNLDEYQQGYDPNDPLSPMP